MVVLNKMREIRVKQENQNVIINALIEAGFDAKACETPLAEWEYEINNFSHPKDWTFDSLVGMAGVRTSASGHQAHKVISALKEQGNID